MQPIPSQRLSRLPAEIRGIFATLALVTLTAGPAFSQQRADAPPASTRDVATQLRNELRLIDAAIDQYSIEYNISVGKPITWEQIKRYFRPGTRLASASKDPLGSPYATTFVVGQLPRVPAASAAALGSIVGKEFWAPYDIEPAGNVAPAKLPALPAQPASPPAGAAAAKSVPTSTDFDRARLRSIATSIKNDLRLIDSAVDQYTIENNLTSGTIRFDSLKQYFKAGTRLADTGTDPLGNKYPASYRVAPENGASSPDVHAPAASKSALAPAVDEAFWSPYQ